MCVRPYIVHTNEGLVPVPCGKCFQCLQDWTKDWRFRLNYELKDSVCSFYLTLTYRDNCLPVAYNYDAGEWQSYLQKDDFQKFLKRVRKNAPDLKFRYFLIGEYGGKYNRCHGHIIFFIKNFPFRSKNHFYYFLLRCWGKGFIYLKNTEQKNINYVSGYFNKVDKSPHLVKPFKLMSKSIGLCYLTKTRIDYFFSQFKTALPSPFGKGFVKLPRYYRKKLDEWTDRIQPLNYGYKWSDIVKMYSHRVKDGAPKEFDYFCRNYDAISLEMFRKKHREALHNLRVGKYSFCDVETDYIYQFNRVFHDWCKENPVILEAQAHDKRLLNDALVRHRYTRLKQNEYG